MPCSLHVCLYFCLVICPCLPVCWPNVYLSVCLSGRTSVCGCACLFRLLVCLSVCLLSARLTDWICTMDVTGQSLRDRVCLCPYNIRPCLEWNKLKPIPAYLHTTQGNNKDQDFSPWAVSGLLQTKKLCRSCADAIVLLCIIGLTQMSSSYSVTFLTMPCQGLVEVNSYKASTQV